MRKHSPTKDHNYKDKVLAYAEKQTLPVVMLDVRTCSKWGDVFDNIDRISREYTHTIHVPFMRNKLLGFVPTSEYSIIPQDFKGEIGTYSTGKRDIQIDSGE